MTSAFLADLTRRNWCFMDHWRVSNRVSTEGMTEILKWSGRRDQLIWWDCWKALDSLWPCASWDGKPLCAFTQDPGFSRRGKHSTSDRLFGVWSSYSGRGHGVAGYLMGIILGFRLGATDQPAPGIASDQCIIPIPPNWISSDSVPSVLNGTRCGQIVET